MMLTAQGKRHFEIVGFIAVRRHITLEEMDGSVTRLMISCPGIGTDSRSRAGNVNGAMHTRRQTSVRSI